jgi:hypothetical protein
MEQWDVDEHHVDVVAAGAAGRLRHGLNTGPRWYARNSR